MPRLTETLNKEPLSKEGNPGLRAALNIEGSNAFEEPRTGPSSCMFARKLSLLRPFLGLGYTYWWVEEEWAHILPLTWDLTGVWCSLANPFNKDKHRLWQKPTISSGEFCGKWALAIPLVGSWGLPMTHRPTPFTWDRETKRGERIGGKKSQKKTPPPPSCPQT